MAERPPAEAPSAPRVRPRHTVETVQQLEEQQLRAVHRVVDRQMTQPTRREFDRWVDDLGRQIRGEARGRTGRTLTIAERTALFATVGAALGAIPPVPRARPRRPGMAPPPVPWPTRMARVLTSGSRLVTTEGVRQAARVFGVMRGTGSRLDDEAILRRIAETQAVESARMAIQTSSVLGRGMNNAIRQRILTMDPTELSAGNAAAVAQEAAEDEWWKVERVVRTESSRVYNAARLEAINELADEIPGLMKRWTERVSDVTGEPLDNRVGQDSMVLHSQISANLFVMPEDPRAPRGMVGQSWAHPPNRPNDRAVLLPWAPGWGMPGYRLVRGRRFPVR